MHERTKIKKNNRVKFDCEQNSVGLLGTNKPLDKVKV